MQWESVVDKWAKGRIITVKGIYFTSVNLILLLGNSVGSVTMGTPGELTTFHISPKIRRFPRDPSVVIWDIGCDIIELIGRYKMDEWKCFTRSLPRNLIFVHLQNNMDPLIDHPLEMYSRENQYQLLLFLFLLLVSSFNGGIHYYCHAWTRLQTNRSSGTERYYGEEERQKNGLSFNRLD